MSKLLIRNLRKHVPKIATSNGVKSWENLEKEYQIDSRNITFFKEMVFDYTTIGSSAKSIIKSNIYNMCNNMEKVYINKKEDIIAYQEILKLHIKGLNVDREFLNLDRDFNKIKFLLGLGFNDLNFINNNPLLKEKDIKNLVLLSLAKYDEVAWKNYQDNKNTLFSNVNITDNDLFMYCLNKENPRFKNNIPNILDEKIKNNNLSLDINIIANSLIPRDAIQGNYKLFDLQKYINFESILLEEKKFQVEGLSLHIKTNIQEKKEFNLFSVATLIHAQEYFVKMFTDNRINSITTIEIRNRLIENLSNFKYDWQENNFKKLMNIKTQSKLNPNEEKTIEEVKIVLDKILLDQQIPKKNENSSNVRKKI